METLLKDIHYGYRTLLKHPVFTLVAVLSLALGIGANTAIFSFIDTVLLRALPVREPAALVVFGEGKSRGIWGGPPEGVMELFGWKQFQTFQTRSEVFSGVAAVSSLPTRLYFSATGDQATGVPVGVEASLVSGGFFGVLGVSPEAGRFFGPDADRAPGVTPEVVLNDAFWTSRFGRSPAVIGSVIRMAGAEWTVVGVAPPGFFGARLGEAPDFWLPMSMADKMPGSPGLLDEPLMQFAHLIARLKPGVSIDRAQANSDLILHQMLPPMLGPEPKPDELEAIRHARIVLQPGARGLAGIDRTYSMPLRILMVVVALVLLIACANVANLLLALGAGRRKEFALRVAIGASRRRLVRQLLTESLLMSAAGGLLGILIANAGGRLLVHLISTGPRALPVAFELDSRVLAFTVLVSLATGILFGLIPALRSSRVDLNASLKEGKAAMALPSRVAIGKLLVAGQVALSLGLLVTAGLLLHSFANLVSIETGFDRQNVLLFKLDTESSGYQPDQRLSALYRAIEEKVARLPGVGSQGISMFTFNEGRRANSFTAPGAKLAKGDNVAGENFVSPGYFSVLHIPLLLGRPLTSTDIEGSEPAVVASQTFARKVFGGPVEALGKQFSFDGEKPVRIVGIAADVKLQNVRDKDLSMVYRSVYQSPAYLHTLAVRVTGDTASVAAAVRAAIQSTEKNLPIRWTTTLADAVSDSLVRERAIAQLSLFFAALALLLSAIGLYGTVSFAVARRTPEIGIRMALGAGRTGVLGMVLRDAMLLTGIGIAAGLPLALLIDREMESILYGLGKVDGWSVFASILALTAVAAIAGYLPARRAASVDPMVALRYE